MVPTEANYTEWFTCSARYFLVKEGFAFLTFGVGQVNEPGFPSAKLLAEGNRMAGLRFCAPVEPARGQRVGEYRVDAELHYQMVAAEWMLYALPQSADPLDQQLAHQKVRFSAPAEVDVSADGILSAHTGATFKQMFERFGDGSLGQKVPSGWTAGDLVQAAREQPASLYLVVNWRDRIVFALYGGGGWA